MLSSTKRAKETWERIANNFHIPLTPEDHEKIIETLANTLDSFAEEKIVELDKIMKEFSAPGTR